METFSTLLVLCEGNSPVTGDFLSQRPVTGSFDVFFDLRLNNRLSKQSWGRWFETPSGSLWRHSNDMTIQGSIWNMCGWIYVNSKKYSLVDSNLAWSVCQNVFLCLVFTYLCDTSACPCIHPSITEIFRYFLVNVWNKPSHLWPHDVS